MQKFQRIATILPSGKLFERVFSEGFATAKKELGPIEFVRITPDLSSETKLHQHFENIQSAAAVIADFTARNPNVMFLAGYARALKKRLTCITQHAEDFPFDQSERPPIIYGADLAFLRAELVAEYCGRSGVPPSTEDPREMFHSIFGDLLKKHGYEHRGTIILEPPSTYTLLEQEMDLPLVQDIARRARELGLRVKLM